MYAAANREHAWYGVVSACAQICCFQMVRQVRFRVEELLNEVVLIALQGEFPGRLFRNACLFITLANYRAISPVRNFTTQTAAAELSLTGTTKSG